MDLAYKYRLYCETCDAWVYSITEDGDTAPTTCPVNTSHTITTSKTSIISQLERNSIKSMAEMPQGGKMVTNRGFQFDAPANSETTFDHKFTDEIFIKEGEIEVKDPDYKDYVTILLIDKDNILGYGVDFILHKYIGGYPLNCQTNPSITSLKNTGITAVSAKDIYCRVIYKNNSDAAVRPKVRIDGYS